MGPLTGVWERNLIQGKSKTVREWLVRHPDEAVSGAKYGRLANLAAYSTDESQESVVEGLVEAKHRPDLLRGFIRQTGV